MTVAGAQFFYDVKLVSSWRALHTCRPPECSPSRGPNPRSRCPSGAAAPPEAASPARRTSSPSESAGTSRSSVRPFFKFSKIFSDNARPPTTLTSRPLPFRRRQGGRPQHRVFAAREGSPRRTPARAIGQQPAPTAPPAPTRSLPERRGTRQSRRRRPFADPGPRRRTRRAPPLPGSPRIPRRRRRPRVPVLGRCRRRVHHTRGRRRQDASALRGRSCRRGRVRPARPRCRNPRAVARGRRRRRRGPRASRRALTRRLPRAPPGEPRLLQRSQSAHPAGERPGFVLRRRCRSRGVLTGPARRRGGAYQAGEARRATRRARRAGSLKEGARAFDEGSRRRSRKSGDWPSVALRQVGQTRRRRRTARRRRRGSHRGAQGCRHPLARQRRGGAIARGVRSLAFTGEDRGGCRLSRRRRQGAHARRPSTRREPRRGGVLVPVSSRGRRPVVLLPRRRGRVRRARRPGQGYGRAAHRGGAVDGGG